jgi:hypothetical protein
MRRVLGGRRGSFMPTREKVLLTAFAPAASLGAREIGD